MKIKRKIVESGRGLIAEILNSLGVIRHMPPPPNFSRKQILDELNSLSQGTWVEVDGYYSTLTPQFLGGGRVNFTPPMQVGIVLKAFLNTRTSEIRTYIAKYLDIPDEDRIKLWGT
jgi:hypothetical protein